MKDKFIFQSIENENTTILTEVNKHRFLKDSTDADLCDFTELILPPDLFKKRFKS